MLVKLATQGTTLLDKKLPEDFLEIKGYISQTTVQTPVERHKLFRSFVNSPVKRNRLPYLIQNMHQNDLVEELKEKLKLFYEKGDQDNLEQKYMYDCLNRMLVSAAYTTDRDVQRI